MTPSRAAFFLVILGASMSWAGAEPLTGTSAFGDWRSDRPGVERRIRPSDLPPPMATPAAAALARVVKRPEGGQPRVPPGFKVRLVVEGLAGPRTLRVAPNGDLFIAESGSGRIRVLSPDGTVQPAVFAEGLNRPYGMAFYPPGPKPDWLYVAEASRVVRFSYAAGDQAARGPAEIMVPKLPSGGGHLTRDIAFSPDGRQMFIAVGSSSNVGSNMGPPPADLAGLEARSGAGAAWGVETDRAAVLVADPQGRGLRHFANGIRNCSGLAIQPSSGAPWCATNERDGLGDDLPPDYVARVEDGAFFGWPWFYTGGNADPRHAGEREDLSGKVRVPDFLVQPHSAPLGLAFYDGDAFPAEYRGDAFVALHGSWNRSGPTGYKVIRLRFQDGRPTGAYQDFMTGFVLPPGVVWGRPAGIAVGKDGALYVSEDANGTIWRVEAVR